MARSWKFDPSDLVVDMPKPARYDDLLGQEKLAVKQNYLRNRFGAQNFIFPGFEDEGQNSIAPNSIKVHTIYATFEVAHLPVQEVQRQERLTAEIIAKLCPPTEGGSNNARLKEIYHDDGMPVVHTRTGRVHTGNNKRERLGENWPASVGEKLGEALFHPESSAQAFQGRSFLGGTSMSVTAGAPPELEGRVKKEKIAEKVAQACIALRHDAQRIKQKQKIDKSAVAQNPGPDPAKVVPVERMSSLLDGDGHSLVHGKQLTVMQQSDPALAKETQDPSARMSVIDRAAALQANRDNHILPLHRPEPKASSHLSLPPQTTHRSRKSILGSLDVFFKTTTEACSGVFYETHRDEICSQLQAQQTYVEEILLTCRGCRGLSEDVRKAKVNGTVTQLLEGFEKTWADSHPEVTVPAIANVIDRQIAYLTLDVAIKSSDVAELDEPNPLKHITAVQMEAMSRQRIILRAITQSLKQEAQSNRHVVAPFPDRQTKFLSSGSPPLTQVPSIGDGSFRPAVQNTTLVIDEVTGVASVTQCGDLGKGIDERQTRHPQKKTLMRKQEAEALASRKRPRTSNAQGDTEAVALPTQPMKFQSLSPTSIARARSSTPLSDTQKSCDEAETEVESNGTVLPAELARIASVRSSTTSFLNAVTNKHVPIPYTNTSGPNVRGYIDVAESFRAHDYNLVSEEQRTEDLLRHREEIRALLGEQSPLPAAGMDSCTGDGFCYVTTVEFDGFGFEGQLELPDDAAPGLDLDSRGVWKR